MSWQVDQLFLGDLVLGYETVTTEADDMDKPLSHHIAHLLLHGLLHLAGYDHIDDDEWLRWKLLKPAFWQRLAFLTLMQTSARQMGKQGRTGAC